MKNDKHSRVGVPIALFLLLFGFYTHSLFSFHASLSEPNDKKHGIHDHHAHANEIGLAVGYIRLDTERDSAVGIHLHYTRRLKGDGIQKYLGFGLGLETLFADRMHYNIMGSMVVNPYRNLSVIFSPGVLIAAHQERYETRFSIHIEAIYEFMIGEYGIGPVVGFAQSGVDSHYKIGLHLGKGF